MSQAREVTIRQRQRTLLLRSAMLRNTLGEQARGFQPALAWADRARDGWYWLRANPQWPVGLALGLAVLRPRRALRWGARLLWAWQNLRRLQLLVNAEGRR